MVQQVTFFLGTFPIAIGNVPKKIIKNYLVKRLFYG